MKVLFIGDTHGLDASEDIQYGLDNFEKVVLLGDYVDSFFVKPNMQLYNLNNICEIVRKNRDKIVALWGNHDYAYLKGISGISGYQHLNAIDYRSMFQRNQDLFQAAWGYINPTTGKYTLATHAGLTNAFWNEKIIPCIKGKKITKDFQMHDAINLFQNERDIMWSVGYSRGGMGIPGILWADYTEVMDDRYEGINQIFGHTPLRKPELNSFDGDLVACIDIRGNEDIVSMDIDI